MSFARRPPAAEPVYLDCAATTPLDPRVREVVLQYLDADFGNAGSRTHRFGDAARSAVEQARVHVARLAAASRAEVCFTSGATEANNPAILGLAESGRRAGRRHIVSTQIEHHAVLEPLRHLAGQDFELTLLAPAPAGAVDAEALLAAVRPDTLLVTVMHANNETGVLQPVEQIARLLRERGHIAYFHVDAAQTFGKQLPALRDPRIDLISVSGHKLYAPKGVGALIARRRNGQRLPLAPLMLGGRQELGLRPGTLPVPLIAGLGTAAALAATEAAERNARCEQFKRRLLGALAPLNPIINGTLDASVPQIINLTIPGIDSDSFVETTCDLIAVSSGAACTTASPVCSHVLEAMRLDSDRVAGAIRFSWHHGTPDPDWPALVAAVRRLQAEIARTETKGRYSERRGRLATPEVSGERHAT